MIIVCIPSKNAKSRLLLSNNGFNFSLLCVFFKSECPLGDQLLSDCFWHFCVRNCPTVPESQCMCNNQWLMMESPGKFLNTQCVIRLIRTSYILSPLFLLWRKSFLFAFASQWVVWVTTTQNWRIISGYKDEKTTLLWPCISWKKVCCFQNATTQ